jgi:hypothetical protein
MSIRRNLPIFESLGRMKELSQRSCTLLSQFYQASRRQADRNRLLAVLVQPPQRTLPKRFASTSIGFRQSPQKGRRPISPQCSARQKSRIAAPVSKPTNPASNLQSLHEKARKIETSTTIPDKLDVLELLEECLQFAQVIVFGRTEDNAATETETEDTPTSSLLDLDESAAEGTVEISSSSKLSKAFRENTSTSLSQMAFNLLRDPKIFITPEMLQLYVRIQALLGKPEYLPEIFHLYATKPIPRPDSNPVTYHAASPRSPKNAIPIELSDAALDAAIAKKDLPLALSVIETTVSAPAFRANKFLRKASAPALALGVTPLCAYTAATAVANWQNTYDVNIATYMAMAGMMAYVGTLATIGFVAVTTSNDQMERVVWQPGLRLRDRWLREEERLYFDRVAQAWGFKEKWRRGEEQGEDWEALREFCGRRQMVLDKTDLMEGME